jgi:phage protein Gp37/Gp68
MAGRRLCAAPTEDAGVEFGNKGDLASLGAAEQVSNTCLAMKLQSAACPARRHSEVAREPSHMRISHRQGLLHLRQLVQLRKHPAQIAVGQRNRLHRIRSDPMETERPISPGVGDGLEQVVSTATSIEWTEVTWIPTTRCDRISPGCDNCCAMRLAKRLKAMGQAEYQRDGIRGPAARVSA